ncbi:MAG: hypothetical protein VCE43_22390, partial [Myxococcota bacterium]
MSASPAQEIQLLIRSGWNLIAVQTCEEDRALSLLERVSQSVDRKCVRWTLTSGLRSDDHPSSEATGTGSLDAGLQAIEAYEQPAIFAILDAHRLLDDSHAIRRLRDLLPKLSARRQVLVLLGPLLHLPLELQRDSAVIDLPLPSEAELASLFGHLSQKREEATPELLQSAVRSALGLTASEATRVFRKACARANGLNEAAVIEIVREKRQALGRTAALSFHEAEAGLSEVGGLGELKSWLGERRRAFSTEARQFGL